LAPGRDREDVHAQIVAAAQRLFDRIGKAGVTLRAVAEEAELARTTIYTHFSSRQELLALLLRPDGEESAPTEVEKPEAVRAADVSGSEGAPDATHAAAEETVPASEQPAEKTGLPEESTAADETAEDVSAPGADGRFEYVMRAQAQALDDIAKRVILPKSLRREGTDMALSRIEARLSVTEQSLTTLEAAIGEKLKAASDETAVLTATLKDTRQRIEKFEDKQLAALAQLRLEIHNFANTTAEPAADAPIAAPLDPEPVVEPPADEPVVEMAEAAFEAPAEREITPEPEPEPARPSNYLSDARKAAIRAALQDAPKPQPKPKSILAKRSAWLRTAWRRRWQLIIAAAILIVVFDVYVFTRFQPAKAAVMPPAPVAAVVKSPRHHVLTPQAQLVRGLRYLNGTGVATNVEKAAVLIERAATNGLPVAQNYTGVLYQTGTGVHANMATAVHWYEAAARSGNLKAMTNLGKAYAGGWEEGTDFTKAAEWFGRAAGFGDLDAQFDLAILYERGQGVSRNVGEAYKWYMIAGAKGDANAASRATVLSAQLSPNELLAAQAAAALFRPAAVDSTANDVPAAR
jgi:TPR repeat protein